MAATLALAAAICFALAAALQQRGQFILAKAGVAITGLAGLVRLITVPMWLLGTLVLLAGYATQAAALDRGKLVVVQPLMVTTIVWALPLGYWLTNQQVVRRQVLGAGVVVVGLALFIVVGSPDAGVNSAPTAGLLIASALVIGVVAALMLWPGSQRTSSLRAAILGLCSGLLWGLSVCYAKPVIDDLHEGLAATAADWRTWAMLGIGFAAFVIQQLSLATGQLAPAMAAVSVSNPALSVLLGIILFQERLTRPWWHVMVAAAALLASLAGALLITMANRETPLPDEPDELEDSAGVPGARH